MNKFFKRTAAAILSLVIVISACSGIFSTFAAGSGTEPSWVPNHSNKTTLPSGNSVVKSVEYRFRKWDAACDSPITFGDEYLQALTDGATGTKYFDKVYFSKYWNNVFEVLRNGKDSYFDIIYTLDGMCDISDIAVMNCPKDDSYFWISYDIYVSDQRETLFDGEPMFKYDNTGAITRTQRFITSNLKAKYVAMHVTAATSNPDTTVPSVPENKTQPKLETFRLDEFNVYGTKDTDYGKPLEETTIPAAPARPVVKSAYAQYATATKQSDAKLELGDKLFDGSLATGNATVKVADSPYLSETDKYVDVVAELNGEQIINDIFVAHDTTADYIPREYAIYIGNDVETLFNGVPYYTYKSDSPKATQHFEVDSFVGKYVGMRIKKPHADSVTGDDSQVRLREFNVYTDSDYQVVRKAQDNDYVASIRKGTSVVNKIEAYYKAPNATKKEDTNITIDYSSTSITPLEALTDGGVNSRVRFNGTFAEGTTKPTKIHVNDGQVYGDIVYTLDGLCNIDYINFIGVDDLRYKKWSISYELYAGNDKSTLFDSAPLYEFNNTKSKNCVQVFACEELSAKYVAMRITATTPSSKVNSDDYKNEDVSSFCPKFTEFNVIGTPDMSLRAPEEGNSNVEIPTDDSMGNSATGYYFDGTDREATEITNSEKLYDSSLSGVASGNKNDSPMNIDGNYTDIVLELKREGTVKYIYVANDADSDYYAREYEIYLSLEKSKLFDKVYYTYKSDNPTRIQKYAIEPLLAKAKYVAIRVKNAHAKGVAAANSFVRLAEFNAYGDIDPFKKVNSYTGLTVPDEIGLDSYTNLSHPDTTIMPSLQGYQVDGDKTTKLNTTYQTKETSNINFLSDGNTTTRLQINQPQFSVFDDTINDIVDYVATDSRYVYIYYDLRSVADLSHIVVASTGEDPLAVGKYAVYVSENRGGLFNGEPYCVVDNATPYNKDGVTYKLNVISFDKTDAASDTARYVGIRIYNPTVAKYNTTSQTRVTDAVTGLPNAYNPVHVRLGEFAVYGEYVDKDFDPKNYVPPFEDISTIDVTKIDEIYGPNLLKPDKLSVYVDGTGEEDAYVAKLKNQFAQEVLSRSGESYADKASNMPANGLTKPGRIVDFVMKLDDWELTRVKGFIFQSSTGTNTSAFVSEYQVWVADEKEELFQGEPLFHYNENDYEITRGQIVTFPEDQQPTGKYFGFRVLNPINGDLDYSVQYLRTAIMYAWGVEEEVISYPANAAENMPCDVSIVNGSKKEAVTDKNLTVAEQKNLTDSKLKVASDGKKTYTAVTDTYATIETGKKDLELIYNLCADNDISRLAVTAQIDSKHGFKSVKVYASSDYQGVYKEKNLVWNAKVGSKTGKVTLEKIFSETKQMRYVRFVFEDTKENVRIYNIDVTGLDTQRMSQRNLSSTLGQYNFAINKNDLETGESQEYTLYPTMYGSFIDGNDDTFIRFYEGFVGQHTYDMLIHLGDLKTVSNIQLSYPPKYRRGWPALINIYIGETKEEAQNKETPDLVVKDTDVSGNKISFDIKPRLVRYIRLEFAKFNPVKHYVDADTGKDIITTTLSEIKITGTRVVGTQTDDENTILQTFTDEETGIDLIVKRLDQNDILSNVVDVRITPEKATNWQMKSLGNNPYFKVIDKKVYKIEFLDMFGNVVTDIGGRDITLTVKAPAGDYVGLTIGNASKRTSISIMDTTESDGTLIANYALEQEGDSKIAILAMTREDDPYWSTIGELEDFSEGSEEDLMGKHDAEWYNSIHTTDGRFTVTPLLYEIETGVRFTATDVSATLDESEYENVLINTPEKSVAVFYDMQITQNGSLLNDGNAYEVAMVLPQNIRENYSDFEVYYSDGMGGVTPLYAEEWDGTLTFQTMSMGNIAIVGTAGSNVITESFNAVVEGDDETVLPPVETGESRATATAVIMLLTAAAFVVGISLKKSAANK